MQAECKKALSNPKINRDFVKTVIREMTRFNQNEERNRKIAKNILCDGFKINDIEYIGSQIKHNFGKNFKYELFQNKEYKYSTYIGKTVFKFKGNEIIRIK